MNHLDYAYPRRILAVPWRWLRPTLGRLPYALSARYMFRTTNENAEKVLRGKANLLCAQRGPRGQDSRPCRFAARCNLRKNESDGETTQPASGTLGSLRSARPQISKPLPNHRMAKAFLPVPRKSVHGRALSDTN